MDFEPFEAGVERALRRLGVLAVHRLDVARRHRPCRPRNAAAERDSRRADRLPIVRMLLAQLLVAVPRTREAALAAGVAELRAGNRADRLDEVRRTPECRRLFIGPDTGAARRHAAFGRDGQLFRNHQAGAADRAGAQVNQMPIGDHAVGAARILGHRRQRDAVAKAHVLQGEFAEQGGHRRVLRGIDRYSALAPR